LPRPLDDPAGYVITFGEIIGGMKCRLALDSIALRYAPLSRYAAAIEPIGRRHFKPGSFRPQMGQRPIAGRRHPQEETPMTRSKTLIAAAAFAAIATSAFSQTPVEFKSGMAHVYAAGKMSAMAMAPGEKNHEAMMKNATKVPNNTVFFMNNGQFYSTSGMLDPTGNFYLP
jgi:hypothetical protein